ncbi:MAG: hypothetical protein K2P51_03620 [Rhabdochlamydiaceae bacterium]|nr:hypothetical protein [Rhabdochlamydiaceae bacterium]
MGLLEFAIDDGLNPKKVASTKGGEYHSPCPACGGKDRFIIWDKLNRFFCRQCRKSGDEVQYNRDFHGLSYKEACEKNGLVFKKRTFLLDKKTDQNDFHFEPQVVAAPPLEWRKRASSFILYSQEQLKKNSSALNFLFKRGFSQEAIEKFHLGWNPNSLWLRRSQWGLQSEERRLWIPSGVVIPSFSLSKNEPIKLKIRRNEWREGDNLPKYVEISGSMQSCAVYAISLEKPIVVVESELDAILVQQFVGDLCCAMALGGASKRPDAENHRLLSRAPVILFSLDVDSAGAKAYCWWKKMYPQMKLYPSPVGKSPGDACVAGIDLRKWISFAVL